MPNPHLEPVEGQLRRSSNPRSGALRLCRASALGATSMLLATGAHLSGGGTLPPSGVLLVATFLVGLTAVTATARRIRIAPLLVLLGIEQLILHEVFAAGSMAWASADVHPSGGHVAVTASQLVIAHVPPGMGTSPLMAVSHLVATLATAWLLAHGEDWLWGLGERAVRAAAAAPSRRPRRPREPRPSTRPWQLATGRSGAVDARGPPCPAWSAWSACSV